MSRSGKYQVALKDILEELQGVEADIEALNAKVPIDPAKESGNLASILARLESLTKALESLSQDALLVKQLDIDLLLRTVLNTPLARLAIDSAGRLRTIIDASGTATPVSQSGTWNLGNFPVEQRWELIQRANIEYAECQRNKFTFT